MEDNLVTDEKKEGSRILIYLALIIILIIVVIIGIRTILNNQNNKTDLDTMSCISKNSLLFVAKGCVHCEHQKFILGSYYDMFNVTDCLDNSERCSFYKITATPTWVINGSEIEGVKTIQDLKKLTEC